MIVLPVIAILLIQTSSAYIEDSYPETIDADLYPENFDIDGDIDIHRRSNHFLRFGRNNGEVNVDEEKYDDYEDFARPTRSGKTARNDMDFLRYGRGAKQYTWRFGKETPQRNPTQEQMKKKESKGYPFLRFGRSIPQEEKSTKRSKRNTYSDDLPKRKDGYLRFGRNSNFLRLGRDPNLVSNPASFNSNALSALELLKIQEKIIANLLMQIMILKKEEKQACARAS